ncbi:MAG: hypothetical protein KDK06_13295 [Gammaproteobacteria bacterium]|nr:hypothetical protein [Gammaproteobacteria bacterium]
MPQCYSTRATRLLTATGLALGVFADAPAEESYPGFAEWQDVVSGNYFDWDLEPGASHWAEGLPPAAGDYVYFNVANPFCSAGNPGCSPLTVDLYAPDPNASPPGSEPLTSDVVQSAMDFGWGDYVIDQRGRDLHLTGFSDPEPLPFDDSFPGTLYVGTTAEAGARVRFDGGATLHSEQGMLGNGPTTYGEVIVAENHRWLNSDAIHVGYSGLGVLRIDDGGVVESDYMLVGGAIDPDPFDVFEFGNGEVEIGIADDLVPLTGARLTVNQIDIGGFTGDGTLAVRGAGQLVVGDWLSLNGHSGQERWLTVHEAGSVDVAGEFAAHEGAGVHVYGGSLRAHDLLFTSGAFLRVDSGLVEVDGGTFDMGDYTGFYVNSLTDAENFARGFTLTLRHGASAPQAFDRFDVGTFGKGELQIFDGASLATGHTLVATTDLDTSGKIFVYGPAARWSSSSTVQLGGVRDPLSLAGAPGGSATLWVGNDARADLASLLIGYRLEANALPGPTHLVTPADVQVYDRGELLVTNLSNRGQLRISTGAYVGATFLFNDGRLILNGGSVATSGGLSNRRVAGVDYSGLLITAQGSSGNRVGGWFHGEQSSTVDVTADSDLTFDDDVRFDYGAEFYVRDGAWVHLRGNTSIAGGNTVFGAGEVYLGGTLDIHDGVLADWLLHPDLIVQSDAVINLDIAGTAFNRWEALQVDGEAALGGTLNIRLVEEFAPSAGDSWNLVIADSITAYFDLVALPALGPGLEWDIAYLADAFSYGLESSDIVYDVLRASVRNVVANPVPLPASLWLTALAVPLLARRRVA